MLLCPTCNKQESLLEMLRAENAAMKVRIRELENKEVKSYCQDNDILQDAWNLIKGDWSCPGTSSEFGTVVPVPFEFVDREIKKLQAELSRLQAACAEIEKKKP